MKFPDFLVTTPPAPWSSVDRTFCADMLAAGALDYAAPQYYDGPGLATPAYVITVTTRSKTEPRRRADATPSAMAKNTESVKAAPIRSPPLLPPMIAAFSGRV